MNLPLDDPIRALAAAGTAATAAGGWVIAQAAAIDSPLEVIGGGILAAVGLLSLRMVVQASRHSREIAHSDEARLVRRIDELETDVAHERKRAARLLLAYDRERQLRIALEAAGVHDRRGLPPELAQSLIDAHDHDDLAVELDALDAEIHTKPPEDR